MIYTPKITNDIQINSLKDLQKAKEESAFV